MKKMLILGATGFIGQNLADFFTKTRKYQVVTHSSTTADLTCAKDVDTLMSTIEPDIVIQAAASTTGSKDVRKTLRSCYGQCRNELATF